MRERDVAIVRFQKRTRWAWVGLALQPIAFLVLGSIAELGVISLRGILGSFLLLLSLALMNLGIWYYAKSKGYGNWVAALSLFSVYGLLVLLWLPNKNRAR